MICASELNPEPVFGNSSLTLYATATTSFSDVISSLNSVLSSLYPFGALVSLK